MDSIDRRTYLALVAAGTVGIVGPPGDDGDRGPPEPDDGPATTTESAAVLGERVAVGDLSVVVSGVRLVDDVATGTDGEALEAAAGRSFAVVDVAVQHAGGGGVLDVGDALTVDAVDGTGDPVDPVVGVDPSAADVVAARLAPGEVVRGDLVYGVDDAAGGLVVALGTPAGDERVVVDTTARRPANARTVLVQDSTSVVPFSRPVDAAGVEVRLERLEHGNDLGGFLQSDAGYEVVAVGVVVENHSGRDRTLRPTQAQLKDRTGRRYGTVPLVVGALNGLDDVEVRDGEDHEGEVVYRVEEGASALYWVFDFGEWDENRRVLWQLR